MRIRYQATIYSVPLNLLPWKEHSAPRVHVEGGELDDGCEQMDSNVEFAAMRTSLDAAAPGIILCSG